MFTNIVIPTDFSEVSLNTAHKAIEIGKKYGATLHFIHVIEPSETIPYPIHIELESYRKLATESASEKMREFISQLNLSGISWQEKIDYGIPHEKMNSYVEENDVDLVMMAPHGKSGIEKFFVGSVTDRMVRTSLCSVLLIK